MIKFIGGFKPLVLFIFVISFSINAFASSSPEFWKLTRGGQTFWLLGSIHVGDDSFYPLPSSITRAFKQAKRLYLEVDVSKLTPSEMSAGMSVAKQTHGRTLSQDVSATSYQQFQKVIKKLQIPEVMFQSFKPWFAAIFLGQMKTMHLGYHPNKGIDLYFSNLAAEQNKSVHQFETFEQQMAYLAKVEPFEQQVFDDTLAQINELDSILKKMMQHWKTGNGEGLQVLLSDYSAPKEVQDWMETTLLSNRNINWVALLEQEKPSSAFIVVGALHVGGQSGLVALLKNAGFKARIIK